MFQVGTRTRPKSTHQVAQQQRMCSGTEDIFASPSRSCRSFPLPLLPFPLPAAPPLLQPLLIHGVQIGLLA